MLQGLRGALAGALVFAMLAFVPATEYRTALAADTTLTDCTDEGLTAALEEVQSASSGTLTLACGEPIDISSRKAISGDVLIIGNGAVLEGHDTQIFFVEPGARLALRDLTLQNVTARVLQEGGAIQNYGALEVINCEFIGNYGMHGGAIGNNGVLRVTASGFSLNNANTGGAIHNDFFGHATIIASSFTNNGRGDIGGAGGGAIHSYGTLQIIASTFKDNTAFRGGALQLIESNATIVASTFEGNQSVGFSGGAIFNYSEGNTYLDVIASTFRNNHSGYDGGGAIISGIATHLTVTDSTFEGNTAPWGGAIKNRSYFDLVINSSTFTGNAANDVGGAIDNRDGYYAYITASTFTGNSARFGSAISDFAGLILKSSILTGNLGALNCSTSQATSAGYNLADDNSCYLSDPSDRQGEDVTIELGPLQDNGGPTETMLPLSGDAIGAIPAGDCPDATTPTDQRGVPRPQEDCESGAVELGQVPIQLLAAYNLGPALQGEPVEVIGVAAGPKDADLTYEFDCDNDGIYEISQDDAGASCTFITTGSHLVSLRASDGVTSATSQTTVVVRADLTITGLNVTPNPASEGEQVQLMAQFFMAGDIGRYTCAIDWGDATVEEGLVSPAGDVGSCAGSHRYPDNDDYTVTVEICDDDGNCVEDSTGQITTNVDPIIEDVLTNAPVPQGQPVTITVIAIDPGTADELTYAFNCDDLDDYETPGIGNQGECMLALDQASAIIGVQVSDDDGGVATRLVEISQVATLCANGLTASLTAPLASGICPTGTLLLSLPSPASTTLCSHPYTGELTWAPRGTCSPTLNVHVVPNDGPLRYCQHAYNGKLRFSHDGTCSPIERPGVIPG